MNQKDKHYTNTLSMPKTDFPMRGNLPQKELEIEKHWHQINLYQKNLKKNQKNPTFILHDGPPYANGDIHIGHALNKILKDFILRFKTMQGYNTPYIPGWDTHGLPIEIAVLKKNSQNRNLTTNLFNEECQKFAFHFIQKQKENFKRLGILGDWDNPYLTCDNKYIANQTRIFAKMLEKKLIFKKLKPVYWSTYLNSSLAESEIEYHKHQTWSIFTTFKIINNEYKNFGQNIKFIIWTTNPWTLSSNEAICVNPKSQYYLISVNENQKYIIGAKVLKKLQIKFNWHKIEIIKVLTGKQLENLQYENTLFNKTKKIILGEFVSDQEGTGLVSISPGHGQEDFLIGQKYNLEISLSIDKKGNMTELSPRYQGIFFQKANDLIIEDLKKLGLLIKAEFIEHLYPHDNRINKPIVFLALSQWFIDIQSIKEKLLKEIKNIKWFPLWGEQKMYNMIINREDWNISRQRKWGVPIPILYDENQKPILDIQIINHFANLFEKYGKGIWHEWKISELLPEQYIKKNNKYHLFTKDTNILDVWFDSGTSYNVIQNISSNFFPADLYLEGSDQYRGWFNSSLITSVSSFNKAAYRTIITHGFVLDGQGQKMSKSKKNIIEPQSIIKQSGADILRLWVASTNYKNDVRIDHSILKQIEEKYRKIRNTLRFMLGNLYDFNIQTDYISFQKRTTLHKLIVLEFKQIIKQIIEAYETYNFEKIISLIYPFITTKISAFYLDFAKDILYIEMPNCKERRTIQSNIYDLLLDLLIILTPIIPHTTSEAYSYLNINERFKKEDIYLENMPTITQIDNFIDTFKQQDTNSEEQKAYQKFLDLRDLILKKLEEARKNQIINKSLEAKIILELTTEYLNILTKLKISNCLHQLLIVSEVKIIRSFQIEIKIIKYIGKTCPRCWNVINYNTHNELCNRCDLVVKNLIKKN
ncbi:MAG: isoleucine--tRNA ligase [Pigeon pea little leaf phytoplasma]|uniref:Isoleucine--tRNA ligase n=1 Tax=Candidatus Phytoplasma fabacearum TaxID=2982628 RepID=A0ABU8ZSA5_9MOLU|nr:isoleucine--tRNA ligase ['Bituminaria bituminosa' little leaf phytoplasma]MDV3148850.1 isoleucine--tRNA ligase [Pigeon pea little leaf phytoplasma]MDO7983544.1 isoleucine--tRNA ligase ['Bituminaria bituminosa' little leaf phytoplasma]MDO8023916.1 isoleucine--tRNA ligase ['Bituminaria bituminosa' little leaf phytoplasma]MDO8030650.1 isoleucine--tRNA ligase ['Bituminaria bituminosa' little leaf phytoplasma]MDV3154036.1 isoleucine--tRNA ligase [Pigeon pea little leaf phytoplasma]